MSEIKVNKIRDGCVVDHVPVGRGLTLLHLLELEDESYVLLSKCDSASRGVKDVVKIYDYSLSEKQLRLVSIVAPTSTYNVIRDYDVVGKQELESPPRFEGLAHCPNPNCVTNHSRIGSIDNKFVVRGEGEEIECAYCEKSYDPPALEWLA